ncbi:MAG: ROK family protein [Atopobiaceae bacterium]|nr:ROK family protein [Atopobiaceae bacterium]
MADKNIREAFFGIDVGGTAIKAGLFDDNGTLFAQENVPTPELTSDEAFAVVCEALTKIAADCSYEASEIRGIGLDVPAPISDDGSLSFVANAKIDLPDFVAALEAAFSNACVVVLNDANAAALGEQWRGAGQGEQSMIMVTLGTGVGGGVVVGGKLIYGRNGAAGEIGHICVNPSETAHCGCGGTGCLEQYASASGVVSSYLAQCEKAGQQAVALNGPSDSLSVFEAAAQNDECAKQAISQMCDYLARALADLACTIDPGSFVIGGGMAAGLDQFIDELIERYQYHALLPCKNTRIVPANLGNRAGIYGSAYQALVSVRQ